ncbi:FUSC family protein [Leucobacter triazinivorans]|uniref:FUSC family protein n=1 Tax=Leucobacter triazinivorans TaxID=1784719 RepID=A0A4P6KFG5_9MICO|nr:FUSC family protein [Leucobacter triazinivorans]QBE49156.1 FUSC family protein [Leucobacter triazinivorans]
MSGAAVRSLFALPPSPAPRRWVATRAALSIGVPSGLLALLGHEEIGLQAAAGAFVALFFAGAGAAERAKALPFVAAALVACAALGAALAPWPWLLAAGLVGVAVCASAFAFAFRVGPPGPVFFVLSYGLAANITAVVDGARLAEPGAFLAAMTCGSLFSYLVALTPLLRRAERARPVRPLRALLPGPWLGAGERELLLRIAIVAVIGTLSTVAMLDPHRAYWTVSAGIAVIGLTPSRGFAVGRGLHRTVGTLLGAALAVALAPLSAIPLLLVALLMLLQFGIELIVVRNYALALICITPLVLLMTAAATGTPDVSHAAGERVVDTALGSGLAVLTGLIHRRGA